MTGCVHGCDDDGWLATDSGLMPCPRHRLDDHQRWADGTHKPTGGSIGVAPPEPNHVTTGRAGLARARAAIADATTPKEP